MDRNSIRSGLVREAGAFSSESWLLPVQARFPCERGDGWAVGVNRIDGPQPMVTLCQQAMSGVNVRISFSDRQRIFSILFRLSCP